MLAKHEVSIVGSPAARRTWTTSRGFREHPHRAAGFHMSDRQAKRDEAHAAGKELDAVLRSLLPPGVAHITLICAEGEVGTDVLCVSNLESLEDVVSITEEWLEGIRER